MTPAEPGHAPDSVVPDVLLFHWLHCSVDRWWSPVVQHGADRPPMHSCATVTYWFLVVDSDDVDVPFLRSLDGYVRVHRCHSSVPVPEFAELDVAILYQYASVRRTDSSIVHFKTAHKSAIKCNKQKILEITRNITIYLISVT